ncbi:hypothetical protein LU633_08555 [Erwinia tracheiphila]|uniref:hypothetical protein n=1 Tax=Erwinia tracheiphila TaxID=65700 RepID=UPI0013793A75|nr:hypothetical protein [Erwinia tracheiphila]UIA97847.1 hypothetical protein LU633_08555 [Erwinia tracheiphila]
MNKVESFDPSGAGTIFEGRSGRPVGPRSDNGKAKSINLGSGDAIRAGSGDAIRAGSGDAIRAGSGDAIRAGSGRGSPYNRG